MEVLPIASRGLRHVPWFSCAQANVRLVENKSAQLFCDSSTRANGPLTSDDALAQMQAAAHTSWHELHVGEVAGLLETDLLSGLSAAEVERRLKQYGPNKVTEKPGTPAWKRFLLQFHQPLIYILLVASGLMLSLGEVVDGSVIFGVVFILGAYRLRPGNQG